MFLYLTTLAQLKTTQLRDDCRGVTALEYGLIAGAVSVVLITAMGLFGPALAGVFAKVSTALG
jgi:pilus assembly protein Flp/PilA